MSHPETIRVKHPDGYAVINKSDYRDGFHEPYEEPAAPAPEQPFASLTVEDLQIALQAETDPAAVALAEEAENERAGGPRKGALRVIAERRAQLEAPAQNDSEG